MAPGRNIGNRLLLALQEPDLRLILPLLQRVQLLHRHVVIETESPVDHVYFPENCVLSIVAAPERHTPLEVAMVGFEGMTPPPLVAGAPTSFRTIVQIAGDAWRVSAVDLFDVMETRPEIARRVHRFQQALAMQFACTALSQGGFTIEERLARWLLMSSDRARLEVLPLVHEFIAAMLSVRRSGVTTAIHNLEGAGAIKAVRGAITVRDRALLEQIAAGGYGLAEREYERLMLA